MIRGVGASAADPFVVPEDLDIVSYGSNRYPNGRIVSTPRATVGENTAILVCAGQSMAANSVDTLYTPTHFTKVDNFNIFDGGMYRAADPMLGTTIRNSTECGSVWGRLADKLIDAGMFDRVILATIAFSGTSIAKWRSGGVINRRLIIAPQRLAAVGLSVTAFLWEQGGTDCQLSTSQATYEAAIDEVIATPRALGFNAPWFVAKETYIGGVTSSAIRAAQSHPVNGTNVFAGPDTDTLTGTSVYRQADDTHWKAAGADAAADLWKAALDTVF